MDFAQIELASIDPAIKSQINRHISKIRQNLDILKDK